MALSPDTLAAILDALDVGVVFTDRDQVVRCFNRAAGEMLQEDPASRIGAPVLDCHPARSGPAVLARAAGLRDGPETMRRTWLNYRGRALRETLCSVRDAEGAWLGTLLIVHDAAEHVDCLRRLGEWTEPRVSGARAVDAPAAGGS